ncbi:MAG: ATP-binding protein [Defluviitaleaceae bacterium]|nr:ATP-binding protein [Defluviitaleaceae bacterium]
MFISLKSKVVAPVIIILVLLMTATVLVVLVLAERLARDLSYERILGLSGAATTHLESLKTHSHLMAYSAAADEGFIRLAIAGETEMMMQFLNSHKQTFDICGFIVTDAYGYVLLRTYAPEVRGDFVGDLYYIAQALEGSVSMAYTPTYTSPMVMSSAAPVFSDDGRQIGVVAAHIDMSTNEFVDRFANIFNSEVTVFSGDTSVASTIPMPDGEEDERAVGTQVLAEVAEEVLVYGRTKTIDLDILGVFPHTALYFPLFSRPDEAIGIFFIGFPNEITISATASMRNRLLMMGTVGLVISVVVTFFVLSKASQGMITKLKQSQEGMKRREELLEEQSRIRKKMEAESQTMKLTRKLVDNAPVLIELWEADGSKCIGCNKYLLNTLGLNNEAEFNNNWINFSAPIQPCGTPSLELNTYLVTLAAREGFSQSDWIYILPNGEEMPADSTWIKIEHFGRSMIIAYSIDLRPIKSAMQSEESNKAKSRFLARMSHEIRTPLSAVLGISEMQLRGLEMPPQTEEAFSKIYDSSKMLLNIVNDILDFSKIESGKMPLINSEYDVASLIGDVSQLHLIYKENKDILFKVSADPTLPAKLYGDVLRIRQIITNLLTNAFKYTESGTVIFSLHPEKINEETIILVISIEDTGIGMTPEQIAELKDDYIRLHDREKPFVSGTGLGIPIVSSLVQMMNARFDLSGEAGKGTRAVVSIPQTIVGQEVLGPELAESLQTFRLKTWSAAKELEFVPEKMQGSVLVVDDVDTNLYVAEAMLEAFGLDVELCESGLLAIDKVKAGKNYDIIFLDHMMPDPDGIKTAKILRGMGYNKPIVALTANAVKGQAEMFMHNGFSGFMAKPIDIKILNSYLSRFLKEKNKSL